MAAYRVLVGINYPGRRAEPGDVVSDLPPTSIKWLLERGVIEPASKKPAAETADDGGAA